ncbi:MAG: hypothetical protein D6806_18295 [Deltaproteobacteria bacterium]|nr:MAG: hypothetical protein D6806_18295 [Deltaproteobacteria bacterium]
MGVMPHTDVDRALGMALSLDIPFWPQLPQLSYYEDMYVQASENFPGIVLDVEKRTLRFSMDKFIAELEDCLARWEDPSLFDVSDKYSAVYPRFMALELSDRPAIRGQMEGPISFGFNVTDQDDRPIIFNETVREFLIEFMARRVNVQLERLKKLNPNAFMFVDEPGLQFIFSAMSGYSDQAARPDMEKFFSLIDRPRGVHLCGNPDWDFLLGLDLDILSLDVYTNGEIFSRYAAPVARFLDRGGTIAWGIVPTNFEPFNAENIESLGRRLDEVWSHLSSKGIDKDFLLSRSLLSPATCCLINRDREKTVEKAFETTRALSLRLREKYLR